MGTSARSARDEWVLSTLELLITAEQLAQLKAERVDSYWETATRRRFASDDDILAALSTRFRMKIANIHSVSQHERELVPEQLARKYRVLPLAISDSVLDIATADPHDLDCERGLAFALGRTVRMSLASPAKISERLDEVYRPDNVIENILENFIEHGFRRFFLSVNYKAEMFKAHFGDGSDGFHRGSPYTALGEKL